MTFKSIPIYFSSSSHAYIHTYIQLGYRNGRLLPTKSSSIATAVFPAAEANLTGSGRGGDRVRGRGGPADRHRLRGGKQ